jgi:hypothetical protein
MFVAFGDKKCASPIGDKEKMWAAVATRDADSRDQMIYPKW